MHMEGPNGERTIWERMEVLQAREERAIRQHEGPGVTAPPDPTDIVTPAEDSRTVVGPNGPDPRPPPEPMGVFDGSSFLPDRLDFMGDEL